MHDLDFDKIVKLKIKNSSPDKLPGILVDCVLRMCIVRKEEGKRIHMTKKCDTKSGVTNKEKKQFKVRKSLENMKRIVN